MSRSREDTKDTLHFVLGTGNCYALTACKNVMTEHADKLSTSNDPAVLKFLVDQVLLASKGRSSPLVTKAVLRCFLDYPDLIADY